MNKPIAVVTGANGFVGSHLVDLLIDKGYMVRCLVRRSSNLRWLKDKPVEIIDSGLLDTDGLRKSMTGASLFFHVAGVVKSKEKEGYFKGNVETTRAILDVALDFKDSLKKIVIVGSETTAGPAVPGSPSTEAMEPAPITTYGISKYEQEKLALTYADRLNITVCRSPAVYGERDTEIFLFFKTFKSGLMTQIGFDKKVVSLIQVRDLVRGLYEAAVAENTSGKVYFITSKEFYTWEQIGRITGKIMGRKAFSLRIPHFIVYTVAAFAELFSMISGKAVTLNFEKAKDLTQAAWICSHEKALKDFGYIQKISIEAGIKETIDWYKQQGWL